MALKILEERGQKLRQGGREWLAPPLLLVVEFDHLARHLLRSSHVGRHHLLLRVGIHVVEPKGRGGFGFGVGRKGELVGWSVGRLVGWLASWLVWISWLEYGN